MWVVKCSTTQKRSTLRQAIICAWCCMIRKVSYMMEIALYDNNICHFDDNNMYMYIMWCNAPSYREGKWLACKCIARMSGFCSWHEVRNRDDAQKSDTQIPNPIVFIAASTIEGAGEGLFARKPIQGRDFITEYHGTLIEQKLITDYTYAIGVNKVEALVGSPISTPGNGIAQKANDRRSRKNNAAWVIRDKRAYLVALTNIVPGEEITVSYGREFWLWFHQHTKHHASK